MNPANNLKASAGVRVEQVMDVLLSLRLIAAPLVSRLSDLLCHRWHKQSTDAAHWSSQWTGATAAAAEQHSAAAVSDASSTKKSLHEIKQDLARMC